MEALRHLLTRVRRLLAGLAVFFGFQLAVFLPLIALSARGLFWPWVVSVLVAYWGGRHFDLVGE